MPSFLRPLLLIACLLCLLPIHQFIRSDLHIIIVELTPFAGLFDLALSYIIRGFLTFFVGSVPFAVVELISREDNRLALRQRYILPLVLWGGYYVLSLLAMAFRYGFEQFMPKVPLFSFPDIPAVLHILVYILLIDFCAYWFHRLEHANPFLWKFHATHHSIEELSAFNHYGHWFEGMFRFFMVYLPVSLIFPIPEVGGSAIVAIWATWTYYVHSNSSDLMLPRFSRYILVDNLYHHYHHGRQREFYDRNFGSLFSVWDVIFGTSKMPDDQQFPATGLEDTPPPASIREYIFHPFSKPRLWQRKSASKNETKR